jgi:predicted DNA-binding protein
MDKRSKTMTIRVSEETFKELQCAAAIERRTNSSYVEMCILRDIETKKDAIAIFKTISTTNG